MPPYPELNIYLRRSLVDSCPVHVQKPIL